MTAPTAEIDDALRHAGIRARHIALVSPMGEAKGRRLAYRVEDEAGRAVKLRQFETEAAARMVFELRAGLEPAFAPALRRHGCVIVEAWIEGRALDADEAAARAYEAGALLGRLHACPLPTGAAATARTAPWRDGVESDLAMLAAAGVLPSGVVSSLLQAVGLADPRSAPAARIHLDFCADNMILDAQGALRVIDNEQLTVDSAGLDLARSFCHWPMPHPTWERFGAGYRAAAPGVPAAPAFWRIVAAALGARVYLQRNSPLLARPLEVLRRCAAGAHPADWLDR
jgi:hypothetical protein